MIFDMIYRVNKRFLGISRIPGGFSGEKLISNCNKIALQTDFKWWAYTRVGLYTGGLIHGWAYTRVGVYFEWFER